MTERSEEAVSRFMAGYNCAQATSSVFAADLGIPEDAILRAATGFGGGMGRTGGACGAVTGAILAIGLMAGGTEKKAKDETYALVREFVTRFSARNGSVSCTDLLGCDLSTGEGLRRSREENLTRTICPRYIRDAVEILEEIRRPATSGQAPDR
ncbi:MAG: C_GCAxxG_C_C family protein [Methanomicrobiales archaeon]|nr:C_GCAxxG_C_C family protein [Methanomicrobiales archaeon]